MQWKERTERTFRNALDKSDRKKFEMLHIPKLCFAALAILFSKLGGAYKEKASGRASSHVHSTPVLHPSV
jgi:hypothetical protein